MNAGPLFFLAFAVSAVLMLAGCADDRTAEQKAADLHTWISERVHEVVLSDGTRCAVLYAERKGGISCDWRSK